MEPLLMLPRLTTITALTNIYLLLSITVLQVYAANKPHQITRDNTDNDHSDGDGDIVKVGDIIEIATVEEIHPDKIVFTQSNHLTKRSLDRDYYYDDEELFRPSIQFESHKETVQHQTRDHPLNFRSRYDDSPSRLD